MGLHLTGKGSILDAIGSGLNTAANAVVAAPKDIGDLIAEGTAKLTGNQQAATNASNAISSNDSNLTNENLATNLGGLSEDVGVTGAARAFLAPGVGIGTDIGNAITDQNLTPQQMASNNPTLEDLANFATNNGKQKVTSAREILGNTLQTGVNIATLGKGKALEQGAEELGIKELGDSTLGKAASRVFGGSTAAGAYGLGSGTSNAIGTAQNPKQAIEDIIKPTVENAALGGTIAGLTTVPALTKAASDNIVPLDEAGGGKPFAGLNDNAVPAPEPNPSEGVEPPTPASSSFVPMTPETAPTSPTVTRPLPTPSDLSGANEATAQLDHDMQDPTIDWTKVQGANKAALEAVGSRADTLRSMDAGAKGGQLISDGEGGYKRITEHTPFYSKVFAETGHAPRKIDYIEEADRQLRTGSDEGSLNYQNLLKHAKAEQDVESYQKADKASGYSRIKNAIPKGVPAKAFIKNLYDKTHSPEFQARNDVGVQLKDVRDTLKGVKALRDRAQKDYDSLTRKSSTADETTIRAKAAELRSQSARYNYLKGQEVGFAKRYSDVTKALDDKYPDVNLTTKRGLKLVTGSGSGFEYTRRSDEPLPPEPEAKPKPEAPYEPYKPTTETKPYSGPNLNKGAFSKEDIANLEKQIAEDEKANELPTRNIKGDQAILDGIKAGDSDTYIVKRYMDATGADEAKAKEAYGLIENDAFSDKIGDPKNNPMYDKINVVDGSKFSKSKLGITVGKGRALLNKNVLTAHQFDALYEHMASRTETLYSKLTPEAKALAENLRGSDPKELAKQLEKGSERTNFLNFAKRLEKTSQTLHAITVKGDPGDATPFRKKYFAGKYFASDSPDAPAASLDDLYDAGGSHALSRAYESYEETEKVTGKVRANDNIMQDSLQDIGRTKLKIQQKLLYRNLLNNPDGEVSYGKPTTSASVQLKDYPKIFADKDLAHAINKRAAYVSAEANPVVNFLDQLNGGLKQTKLALGGFHIINEGVNQLLLDPKRLGDVAEAFASPKVYAKIMDKAEESGALQEASAAGLRIKNVLENDQLGIGGKVRNAFTHIPGHNALFERQIPISKLLTWADATKGLDIHDPDEYNLMRNAAKAVNNTFGGINRLAEGLTPRQLKWANRVFLASDYNEGQLRNLFAAISKGGIEGRIARQVVVGRLLLLAAPGIVQGVITGKIGNDPEKIAKFVATQLFNPTLQTSFKTTGGTPKQVSLLPGILNKIYRTAAPAFEHNNPNKLSGVESELSGNLSPGASLLEEEKANKDYYGNPMHGKGLNAAEDVAQALNSATPIPVTPGARALENVSALKNSKVIKILSGGQSAITPEEAAIDISGVGRVAANPNAPELQILNNRQLVRETLSSDNQGVLDYIHPSWNPNLSKAQQAAIYNNPNYEINKWTSLADNRAVFNAMAKQDAFAKAHGEPGNPLFALNPHDQAVIIRYEQLKASDPGSDANDTAAVIYANNKDLITKFENDTTTYSNQMNALYQSSGGLKGEQGPQITPGGVPYPQASSTAQANNVQAYYNMLNDPNSTSQQRVQFLTNNPNVGQYMTAVSNYENAKRADLGEPLLKDYPTAAPGLENWINQYVAASKTERTALRDASPDQYNAMSNYMAQVDEYNLARTAGQAKFQGQDFSQANLKEIYNLGQYDISAPPAGATGTADTYVVDPQKAYAAKTASGGSGGTSAATENFIAKLEKDLTYHAIHENVKYDYNVKKVHLKRIYKPEPIRIVHKGSTAKSLLKPQPKKITLKSVPTT